MFLGLFLRLREIDAGTLEFLWSTRVAQKTPCRIAERDGRDGLIWFIWFVLFIWFVSFNQTNQTDQVNKRNKPVLACLAPWPVALGDLLSILLDEDVPHDGLGQGDRSWMDSQKFDRGPPRPYNDRLIRVSS